ncbi:SH3 domain-containing protein [Leptospira venezuelensis]|uniref:SH3 domain-containing protein n=1 Tax=Leptospira venezuelensis TaxID=1958811 RepID=UPI0012FF9A2C|nr:SH3 domain-containing protein [Leptospira venezuelensis]
MRLRVGPSLKSEVIENLSKGDEFDILSFDKHNTLTIKQDQEVELKGIWVKIKKRKDGKEGYIFSSYIGFRLSSVGYLVYPRKGDVYEIIGVSTAGVLENHTEYSSRSVVKLKQIPKKVIILLNPDGTKFGSVGDVVSSSTKLPDCEYIIKCVTGKLYKSLPESKKYRASIGGTFSSNLALGKMNISESIDKKFQEIILKDSLIRLKSTPDLPAKFLAPNCQRHCKFFQFKAQNGNVSYIISEHSRFVGAGVKEEKIAPYFYRIDKVNGNEIENLEFYSTFSDQNDIASTIGITDINDDGLPEIWRLWHGYEWWSFSITILKDDWAIPVYAGGGGGV